MKPTIMVIRAVGAEFARRIVRPLIILGAITMTILLIVGGWLTTQSGWWWILEALFIIGSLVFTIISLVALILLRAVTPSLTKAQRRSVKNFVDKLERVAETIQTPQIVLAYYVIRDTLNPRQDGFVETISNDSKSLALDFSKLRKEFRD